MTDMRFVEVNTYLNRILVGYKTMILIESHDSVEKQLKNLDYLFYILENAPNKEYINIMEEGDDETTAYKNPLSYVNFKDINEAICKFISLNLIYVQA